MTEPNLLDVLESLYEGARDLSWHEADLIAELVTGHPMSVEDVSPGRFRDWLAGYTAATPLAARPGLDFCPHGKSLTRCPQCAVMRAEANP